MYSCGDVVGVEVVEFTGPTVPFKQIVIAMGEGAKAALSAFEDRIHSVQPTALAAE